GLRLTSTPAGTITALTSRLTTKGSFSWLRMPHSVETVATLRSSAAFRVCQQRLAHLTRAGNSRTPESAASLPREVSGPAFCCVNRECTRPYRDRTVALSLPLTASVMSEAEAVEMAQPLPSKRMSSMRSSLRRSHTVRRSPQSGLCPSACESLASILPKLRGRLL